MDVCLYTECVYMIYGEREREREKGRNLLGWRYFWSHTRPATAITTAITYQEEVMVHFLTTGYGAHHRQASTGYGTSHAEQHDVMIHIHARL